MTGNRLADASSSYLRSAAHQPTRWYAWGPDAFEAAKREDKPILLDIGAVWCHWCHVMDRESYEDEEVAKLLNDLYVPVKVDRDERPDVDARYQRAIQAMTGQGGWPLTAFLTPEGRPFYGGTYFPPKDAHGRPAFRRVLESVAEAYRNRKDEIADNVQKLAAHLDAHRPAASERAPITEDLLEVAVGRIRGAFDSEWGGFGRAPKFPHPSAHDFLLSRGLRGDAAATDVLVETLTRMRAGGVYDQVAGGFHRYSVDRQWLVPHFEKMLYDNAGLLRNYARAGAALGREAFTRAADEIAAWMRDVLAAEGGAGFGGSQDADVGLDDDGDAFTWSLAEFEAAIGDAELAKLAARHWGVSERGHMHHDPTRNVLHVEADAAALAAAMHVDESKVEADLAEARARLVKARAARTQPFVDPIRYTAWNGMAIGALLEHAGFSGNAEWDALALRALDRFLDEAFDAERGFARHPGSAGFGLLDDNAQMLDALLEAHFATGEPRYLDAARTTADLVLAHFPHPAGGFKDRAEALAGDAESAPLAQPERPTQDAPTASANGVVLRALLRLADASHEERYREAALDALERMTATAAAEGVFAGAVLLAAEAALVPPPRLEAKGDLARWRALARREALPGTTLVEGGPDAPEGAVLVCLGTRCLAPAYGDAELLARLDEAGVRHRLKSVPRNA